MVEKQQLEFDAVKTNVDVCRQVLACADIEAVNKEIAEIVAAVGPALAGLSPDRADAELRRFAILKFVSDLADHAAKRGLSDEAILSFLPELAEPLSSARGLAQALKEDPQATRLRLSRLFSIKQQPATSADNRRRTQEYMLAHDRLQAALNAALSEQTASQARLQQAKKAFESAAHHRAEAARLAARLSKGELALSILRPGGKFSVEKQMVETMLSTVLEDATRLWEMCGMAGELKYTAEEGMQLLRGAQAVPACELSGGETSLAALTLRLSLTAAVRPVPFMVLDDITGPLGSLTPDVCSMLSVYARETGTDLVLITHDYNARGDCLVAF
jgi:hypothetical protein